MSTRTSNGRGWAYIGTTLGGAVSLAANAAHSYVAPAGAPATWRPHTGAIMFAVFWPIALFVAIEMLARVLWRTGALWVIVRYVGLGPVAVVAAIVSYQHLSGLLATYGENRLTVVIGPLAVDGLMVLSAAAVMATSPRRVETASETAPEPVHLEAPKTPVEQPENRTPKPRTRTAKKTTRKSAPKRRTDEELLAEASALNEAALASGGEPVSKRALKTALRVGQPTADRLHAVVVVTAPETAPESVLEHANGAEV
jgi:hypothetical protein